KSAVSAYHVVYCRKNRYGKNRLGITASTKLGNAVVRNRVRRRYRELYRLNEGLLGVGYDIVIVARSKCVGADFALLGEDLLRLFGKLGLRADTI
ncbi:MAG: ribonuclease P protein component, partial [Oscillospiraceae bacterium]|nr:ribonuclease P protein component [Oscillospiraceae bacterium]